MTGVYAIRNKVNTKIYVGSAAVSIRQRFHLHRSNLRLNRHHNAHLQQAWNMYGEDSFEFLIVEECPPGDCLILEQYYIDQYEACNPECGYNLAGVAGSTLGFKFSAESRKKVSESLKGKTKGVEKTPEHRARISAALKGKSKTPEHCTKLKGNKHGGVHKGRKMTPEWIEKRQHTRRMRAWAKKLGVQL